MAKTEFEKRRNRRMKEEKRQARKEARAERKATREARKAEMTKEDKDKRRKRRLILGHRIWRMVNWAIIVWLENFAIARVLSWIEMEKTWDIQLVLLLFTLAIAGVMVVFAEGTSHDLLRRNLGWILILVSEIAMLVPPLVVRLGIAVINSVGRIFGGNFVNASIGFGPLWAVNAILAVVVAISLAIEELSTDNNLKFARTPQKRNVWEVLLSKIFSEKGEPSISINVENFKK